MNRLEYILPPFVADYLRFLKHSVKYFGLQQILRCNKQFENTHVGKDVYVLANGPSLNNYQLDLLFGKEVIVMNAFHLAPWKDKVKIVAHCFGEPVFSSAWEDPWPMFNETDADSYWLHHSVLKKKGNIQFKGKPTMYMLPVVPSGVWPGNRKLNLAMPSLGYITTAQMAIMVAMYMGYKKIFLLGFDHDWLSQRNISPHFYEETDSVGKADLSRTSYYDLINLVRLKWDIYYKLKAIADASGCHIVNLSKPSYLDVFDTSD
jgi:hypothetical protein